MDELAKQKTPNWKVKVYLLNDTGNWDDCGTGTLEIVKSIKAGEDLDYFKVSRNDDSSQAAPSIVPSERLSKLRTDSENPKVILSLPILKENQFEKQGDSIISWVDKELNEEIAISFLDTVAANETWRTICMKLGKNPVEGKKNSYSDLDQLLMPSFENLEKIRNEFETKKDWMLCAVSKNPAFLDNLNKVFQDAEDLESLENLHIIHDIVKMMDDIENTHGYKPRYRDFLKNQSYYKKVIEFEDPAIVKKIHLNFRISYLRDSVVSSIIDDPLTNQFNTIIYYNNHEIYEHIISNPKYFDHLFQHFLDNLNDSIGFLFEFCQIVKSMIQVDSKIEFAQRVVERNIFSVIGKAFRKLQEETEHNTNEDRTKTILKINLEEVLFFIVQLKLNAFVDFLKSSPDEKILLEGILHNFFYGDQGLQIQTTELLKYLIDAMHERKIELLDYFYDNFLPQFLNHYNRMDQTEQFYSFVQQYTELLIYCIKSHGYRIRHYIIHHKLLLSLYKGFDSPEKSITLALIRLIKHIILGKDDFLIKHIAEKNLLDQIIEVYLKNARKNNLINSSCLELFEIIRKENAKKLIISFVERYQDRIKEFQLEKTFEKLFIKYEQIAEGGIPEASLPNQENEVGNTKPASSSMISENLENYNSRELSYMEDEEYFEGGEEEIPNNSGLSEKTETAEKSALKNDQEMQVEDPSFKSARDNLLKLQNKLSSKKKQDDDEDNFVFGGKSRSRSVPNEKSHSSINIQFALNDTFLNDDPTLKEEPNLTKRQGSELEKDDEIKEESKIEAQKRIKF